MGLLDNDTALKEEIVVLKPDDCPFCSECSCSLNWQIEGPTADDCPKGRYPDYTFPDDCPLHKAIYIIKKKGNHGTGSKPGD